MPKNRRRSKEPGAKSVSIRTKFKLGGRKSSERGAKQLSFNDLISLKNVRARDKNKLFQVIKDRRLV